MGKKKKDMEKRIEEAFDIIGDIVDNPDKYSEDTIIFLLDDREIASIFTRERLRLIRLIRDKSFASISELAKLVKRDVSRVKKDLRLLEKHGIIHLSKNKNCVTIHTQTRGIFIPLN